MVTRKVTHSLHEAGVELIFSKDVQVEALDAEKHRGFDHGEGLLQPLPAGHHRQVHGGLRPPLNAAPRTFYLPALTHDIPEGKDLSSILL